MELEESIYSYLSNYAGLTALVDKKIFPLIVPENVILPAVIYQQISSIITESIYRDDGTAWVNVQFKILGTSYSNSKAIAKQVKTAFFNFSGVMGSGGVNVGAVRRISDDLDFYDDEKEYSIIQEYSFFVDRI